MNELVDRFIDALPNDKYGKCPCGCGRKIKFIIQEGEVEADKHEKRFYEILAHT